MQNLSSSEPCPTLEQIQEQFETWRNQPRRSRKIPEELWDAAARLCLRHSLLKVSRALRLGYKELKERVQRIRQRPSAGSFVELGSLLPATEMVVDCEDASGRRLHIQYRGGRSRSMSRTCSRPSGRSADDPDHPQMRILLTVEPVDFRKGIDGLGRWCREVLKSDPFSGALFVFSNKGRSALRVLVYDGQGFWLCHKRLTSGRFRWPGGARNARVRSLAAIELQTLLANGDFTRLNLPAPWRSVSPQVPAP